MEPGTQDTKTESSRSETKIESDDYLPRRPSPELLRSYLKDHDAPCPVCGYNLRGVVMTSCPECDSPIELTVGSSNSRLGAWLFAMLAFAMALGFDLVIGAMMVLSVVMTRGEDAGALFLMISLVTLALASIGMLWVLVVRKKDWMCMDRRHQWKIAWGIFTGVFLVHLSVGVSLFILSQF